MRQPGNLPAFCLALALDLGLAVTSVVITATAVWSANVIGTAFAGPAWLKVFLPDPGRRYLGDGFEPGAKGSDSPRADDGGPADTTLAG